MHCSPAPLDRQSFTVATTLLPSNHSYCSVYTIKMVGFREELRLLHKACREGRTADVVNLKSVPPDLLETRSAATGRTVSDSSRFIQLSSGSLQFFRATHTNNGRFIHFSGDSNEHFSGVGKLLTTDVSSSINRQFQVCHICLAWCGLGTKQPVVWVYVRVRA